APLDGLVERAGEGHDRLARARRLARALLAPLEPATRRSGAIEIERIGAIAPAVGNGNCREDLARGGDHAPLALRIVEACGSAACRRRAEVGGGLAGFEVAHDLAPGVRRYHEHVGHLAIPAGGRRLRRM